jgi:DNA polymerase
VPAVDPAAQLVVETAAACTTLEDVAGAVRGCVACAELVAERTTVVVGDFPIDGRLMLVGEAPGAHEDLLGRPFVGKAGQLLDSLLTDAGLSRESVLVANVVNCRPPGNRLPRPVEARRCTGWLDRQVELAAPALVVTLGLTALRWAAGPGQRLRDVRGVIRPWRTTRLLSTYHPSAALRFGPAGEPMRLLRADLALAGEAL